MSVEPRLVGLIALTALIPATVFIVLKSEWIAVVTLVNVLLIAGSLAIAFSPHEEEHGEHAGPNGV